MILLKAIRQEGECKMSGKFPLDTSIKFVVSTEIETSSDANTNDNDHSDYDTDSHVNTDTNPLRQRAGSF